MSTWAEKWGRLAKALRGVEKQFGKGTAVQLDGQVASGRTEAVPSGSLLLDRALGCGGYPRGRITELFGHESSGKTSLALQSMACTQAQGGLVAFVDAEHALDLAYAQRLGVQTDKLVLIQASTAEQTWEVVRCLLEDKALDFIVVDSVAALLPKAELESEQPLPGLLHAQVLSHAIRKLTGPLAASACAMLLLNQLRYTTPSPGTSSANTSPGTLATPGGVALKFFSSLRCHVENVQLLKSGTSAVGMRLRVSVLKNKCAPPAEPVEIEMSFSKGICKAAEALELGRRDNKIVHSEEGLFFGKLCLGKTQQEAVHFLKTHPKELDELVSL